MEIRNKGTVQNVTNIKSNVCFYYKCIINIYAQLQILINLYVSIINIVGGWVIMYRSERFGVLLFKTSWSREFQVMPLEEQFTGMNKVTVRIRHVFDCSSSLWNIQGCLLLGFYYTPFRYPVIDHAFLTWMLNHYGGQLKTASSRKRSRRLAAKDNNKVKKK